MANTPDTDAVRFGQNLRQFRRQAGLTQQELANRAEIDRATVSLIENAREEPRADTVRRLAAVLHVNPADFWRGDAPGPESSAPVPSRPAGSVRESELQYEPVGAASAPHPGLDELLNDERSRLMLGITPDEEEMLRSIRTRRDAPLGKDFFIDVLISFRRHRMPGA